VKIARLSSQVQQQIEKAAGIVKAGGVVVFPTDTIYGLGANPFNRKAVDRIYEIKQRPRHLPLPVLLAEESELDTIAAHVPEIARLLIKRFWPGGLTIVLHRAAAFPGSGTENEDTIAVRIPNHPVPLALVRLAAVPVIGTSANLSSQPGALIAEDAKKQLGSAVDFIIDGGTCPGGVESTVVDVTKSIPVILRKGAVSEKEITTVFQEYERQVSKRAYCSRK
jgi:L-threonylcarbamoyladenylate synthase